MPLSSSKRTARKKNFDRPKILLLDFSYQNGWGMLVSFKGVLFEHAELAILFLFRFVEW